MHYQETEVDRAGYKTTTIRTSLYEPANLHDIVEKCAVKLLWDRHLNVSQLPFPSSQYCLEQYCTSYSTSNRFHLSFVYFTQCDVFIPIGSYTGQQTELSLPLYIYNFLSIHNRCANKYTIVFSFTRATDWYKMCTVNIFS